MKLQKEIDYLLPAINFLAEKLPDELEREVEGAINLLIEIVKKRFKGISKDQAAALFDGPPLL